MRSSSVVLVLVGSAILATLGCSSSAEESASAGSGVTAASDAQAKLAGARAKLEARLAASNHSYRYEVETETWSGSGTVTSIIFQKGAAVQRNLTARERHPQTGAWATTDSKGELAGQVGSTAGYAEATPIAALYDKCRDDVLTKPAAQVTFTLDAEGLLGTCTYVPANADIVCPDCNPEGVSIARFDTFDLAGPIAALEAKVSKANGDYNYTVAQGSFSGDAWSTKLTFRNNAPYSRDYRASSPGAPDETWSEQGSNIGQHAQGAPAVSLARLYAQCKNEVLGADLSKNWLTLNFDSDGLLEHCTVFPELCADDCSSGVMLSDVKFGQ